MQTTAMDSFAQRLREARIRKGLSQSKLASKVGLSQSALSALENDPTRSTSQIVQLAKVLMVSPQWLETGVGLRDGQAAEGGAYVTADSIEELAEKLLDKGTDDICRLWGMILDRQKMRG